MRTDSLFERAKGAAGARRKDEEVIVVEDEVSLALEITS